MSRLVMRGVRKAFAATQALAGVDLEVAAGEVHALIGENGAGKSTLMKVLSGAHAPDAGTVTLDDATFRPGDPIAARRLGIAIVYQELAIAPHLSIAENVLLGHLPVRGGLVHGRERDRIARAALAVLGRSDLPLDQPAGTLSLAEQQLVEIARAIASAPKVLVLDEPTSSLTRSDAEHLLAVVRRLAVRGVSVIYISHFLEDVMRGCDRFTVLRDGASVAHGAVAETTIPTLIRHMVGREVTEIYPRIPHTIGEPLLSVRDLAGLNKPTQASFVLRQGEIFGVFGLVGAGRSEMLRALFGLDARRAGAVRFAGADGRRSPSTWLRAGLGMASENRKEEGLLLDLPIADNMTLSKLSPYVRLGLLSNRQQAAATSTWMTRLGVKASGPSQAVGHLSGGNQQKVAIGRLLHHGCRVLLLDEPTRGIDIGAKAAIYRLIGELAATGTAIILVSSYIPELLGICDTVAAMSRGILGDARPVGEWNDDSLLAAAIGQEAA